MALYDQQLSPEEMIRPGAGIPSKFRSAQPFAATSGDTTGELSPAFIGGSVDPTTGNLVPGTVEGVKKGSKPTPFAGVPATPSSLLSTV